MQNYVASRAGRAATSARHMRSSIALYAGRATTNARHMRNYVASRAGRRTTSTRHMCEAPSPYMPAGPRQARGIYAELHRLICRPDHDEREAYGELHRLICRPDHREREAYVELRRLICRPARRGATCAGRRGRDGRARGIWGANSPTMPAGHAQCQLIRDFATRAGATSAGRRGDKLHPAVPKRGNCSRESRERGTNQPARNT